MPYFNVTNEDHTRLLPKFLRDWDELDRIATDVETDVINEYTKTGPDIDFTARGTSTRVATQIGLTAFHVFIAGFEPDPLDIDVVDYPNLEADLRRTIALVMRWRYWREKHEDGVSGESDQAGKNRTFSTRLINDDFPENWDRYIRKYDTREPGWAL